MKEHYALSNMQLKYLNGQDMPNTFNSSKEESRMLEKAKKAWSILVPILRSDTVDQEFKDRVLLERLDGETSYNADEFFKYLVNTYGNEPFEDIQNKIHFAKTMITHGFAFFQLRFKSNRLVSDKIEEIKKVLDDLEDMVRTENQNKEALEIYRMRKRLPAPPTIRREDYWKAECIHCYSFSLDIAKTEQDAIKSIEHDVRCNYLRQVKGKKSQEHIDAINFQYIRTIPPLKKK